MNYRIIQIKTIPTDGLGSLSFFEGEKDFGFCIKRVYYITGAPVKVIRGFHAHKMLKQLLFCPFGSIEIKLDDGVVKENILLNDPSKGLVIEEPLWREMTWQKSESVLCVAASDYYDPADYIRDYDSFCSYRSRLHTPNDSLKENL